jgi:predicted metal-binding protein
VAPALPADRVRCHPAGGCGQSDACARAVPFRQRNQAGVVDASICLTVFNPNCPMFIAKNAVPLLAATEAACRAIA